MKSVLCMLGWWAYEERSLHVGLVGAFFACWVGGCVLCMLGWWVRSLHVGLVGAFFACWVGGRVLCMLGQIVTVKWKSKIQGGVGPRDCLQICCQVN